MSDTKPRTDRLYAIERIVEMLSSKDGRKVALVVSPDHWASVVFADEVREALVKRSYIDYEMRSDLRTLTTALHKVFFVLGSNPDYVMGFMPMNLLVKHRPAQFSEMARIALQAYKGRGEEVSFND